MSNDFHVAWCPFCNQGFVNIVKNSNTDELILECDECYSYWLRPDNIQTDNSVPYHKEDKIIDPSLEDIRQNDWEKYIKK